MAIQAVVNGVEYENMHLLEFAVRRRFDASLQYPHDSLL